jgi:flagellar biosynthesis/type III secretory pathway chaperone
MFMRNAETDYIAQTLHKANALKAVLKNEFSSLKEQDLPTFENLQQQKIEILDFLASEQLVERIKAYTEEPESLSENVALWQQVMELMKECKELHIRNEVLINRKLETIRGALHTIQTPDPLSSVEVYDRLGKIRSSSRKNSVGNV